MVGELNSFWGWQCMLSRFWLLVTPPTVARQVPLSTGFSRQEHWSGLPCPPPGGLPRPGIKPASLGSPHRPVDSWPLAPPWQRIHPGKFQATNGRELPGSTSHPPFSPAAAIPTWWPPNQEGRPKSALPPATGPLVGAEPSPAVPVTPPWSRTTLSSPDQNWRCHPGRSETAWCWRTWSPSQERSTGDPWVFAPCLFSCLSGWCEDVQTTASCPLRECSVGPGYLS